MKIFDFIKQVFRGKSISRILFNWQVQKQCKNLNGVCIDLASGDNPSYYKYWQIKNAKLIKIDYNRSKNPDKIIDLNKSLPFENNFADSIFLFNAVYIIKDPYKLMREINRVLKTGGRLFMNSPFIFNEAREPDDFRRLTSQGLKNILRKSSFFDFEIIPYGERFTAGAYLWHSFFIFNFIRLIIFTKALLFDKLIPKKIKKTHPCPLGYFVIAKKTFINE